MTVLKFPDQGHKPDQPPAPTKLDADSMQRLIAAEFLEAFKAEERRAVEELHRQYRILDRWFLVFLVGLLLLIGATSL